MDIGLSIRTGKLLILAWCSLLGILACSKPEAQTISGVLPSAEVLNARAERGSSESRPYFSDVVLKAKGVLCKTKDDAVAALGTPDRTLIDPYSHDGSYEWNSRNPRISIGFRNGQADDVHVTFESPPNMGDVWRVIGSPDKKPTIDLPHLDWVRQYWLDPENYRNPNSGSIEFSVDFKDTLLDGSVVEVAAVAQEPSVVGEKKFSTKTDRIEFTDLRPNPNYKWQQVRVKHITIIDPNNQRKTW